MAIKERLIEYVELDERTSVQKLSLLDQIRVFIRKLTYDESRELKKDDVVSKDYLTKKANLIDFLMQGTDKLRTGHETEVEMEVSSKFDIVLDEVLKSPRFKDYYRIEVDRPNLDYDIDHFITVKMIII